MKIAAKDYLSPEDWHEIEEACQQAGYCKSDFNFVVEDISQEMGTMKSGLPETNVNAGLKVIYRKSGQSKTYPYLQRGCSDGAGIFAFFEDLHNRLF